MGEKASLGIADNYETGTKTFERSKTLLELVEQFGSSEVNAAINGGYFAASGGPFGKVPGLADGSITGLAYTNGKDYSGPMEQEFATIIWTGTEFKIESLKSAYDPGVGGWMLSGADPHALVVGGKIQSGWTINAGNEERSIIGYTSDNAPIIVSTTDNSKLTYAQAAQIMQNLGAEGAIMLDGGNSTSFYEKTNGMIEESPFFRPIPNFIVISDKPKIKGNR